MKEKFDYFLENRLSEYDKKYLNTFDYVMILYKNNNYIPLFCNLSYGNFIEYPDYNKTYNNAMDVLNEEINLTNSESGVIYEKENDRFKVIALIEINNKKI